VIENTQRDLNIALINELSMIFRKMNIDTNAVLDAAATKWNFLRFKPGLVGGHCIGVDPYYLTSKAQSVGHNPEVILAGRRTNDSMGAYVAERVASLLAKKGVAIDQANVLILGFAFKPNCPDLRNTKVVDVHRSLQSKGAEVEIYDPLVDAQSAQTEYGIALLDELTTSGYQAVILGVGHDEFAHLNPSTFRNKEPGGQVFYDVSGVWPYEDIDERL
jgi:UDP-N-acetyl-D-glucosamine/UDP-N-acetyl-D-galactosamine dehydrogenase